VWVCERSVCGVCVSGVCVRVWSVQCMAVVCVGVNVWSVSGVCVVYGCAWVYMECGHTLHTPYPHTHTTDTYTTHSTHTYTHTTLNILVNILQGKSDRKRYSQNIWKRKLPSK